MYSNRAFARCGCEAYFAKFNRAKFIKGPSGEESIEAYQESVHISYYLVLTVPRRTNRPEALVTGLAVCAVRGAFNACSIVPGRPD